MTERNLLRRSVVAGLTAAVAVSAVGASVPVAAADGAFDPMACAGKAVRIALVDGERDEKGLQDKEAEIEAATGIDIQLTTMAIGQLGESIAQNLRAPESAFDIVHVIGFNVAGLVGVLATLGGSLVPSAVLATRQLPTPLPVENMQAAGM